MKLQEQLQGVRERLAQLDPNNRDHLAEISGLKTQETELAKQVSAEEELATLEKNHEERVQESQQQIAYILDTLSEGDLNMRDMCAGENEYQLLRIKVQQVFTEQADHLSRQISGAEERELQLRRQNDDLQDKIEAAEAQLRHVSNELQESNRRASQFEFERNEALQNRDNAAAALEEARNEVDRLNSQVDDLRKEIAVGARNAYKVTDSVDTAEQIAQLVKQIKESRIKVINMKPVEGDFKRTTWQAEDAATGELFTFNHLEKGKYVEITPEEGLQFRIQTQALSNHPLDESIEITPPALEDITRDQFRESADDLEEQATSAEDGTGKVEEPTGEGNDQQILSAEVAALKQTVSTLKADVDELKRRVA